MNETLLNVSLDLLAILLPVLVGGAIALLEKKIGTEKVKQIKEQFEAKEGLAYHTVCYIEQAYKDLHGPVKLAKATEWLINIAKEHGLKITAYEVTGLIEKAVKDMNEGVKQVI